MLSKDKESFSSNFKFQADSVAVQFLSKNEMCDIVKRLNVCMSAKKTTTLY